MTSNRNDKWTGRKFKVTVHLPDTVSESVRQTKIERLYDILKSYAEMRNAENENADNDDENCDK